MFRCCALLVGLVLISSVIGCATKAAMEQTPDSPYMAERFKVGDCVRVHLRRGSPITGILTALPEKGTEVGFIEISTKRLSSVNDDLEPVSNRRTYRIPLTEIVRIDGYPKVVYKFRKACLGCAGCCLYPLYILTILSGRGDS